MNRFKALEVPQDPTDYEEYEDVAPYNKLEDGKWTSLRLYSHPIHYIITNRFNFYYGGKLFWFELNKMKEEIENKKKRLHEVQMEGFSRRRELNNLVIEQEKLCSEDTRASTIDTILLSAISARNSVNPIEAPLGAFVQQVDDAMNMMYDIISFIPLETCAQKLQKHIEQCNRLSGKYKCTKDHVTYMCQFMDNGRCSHFYEIERANEELEIYDYYDQEEKDEINDLEYNYKRALAVKENRLQEYLDDMYDDY